jgi:hypothetical protein
MTEDIDVRMEDPKEVKNWRVHLYCIAVCCAGVAMGKSNQLLQLGLHSLNLIIL